MKYRRKQCILWLFRASQVLYRRFKEKQPWDISTADLLEMPPSTYGYHLGCFLTSHDFELIPKVERHDAYHVLTGFSTAVEDEIALQFLCFGNGKRTPYLFAVLFLGTLLLPDYFQFYRQAYSVGKESNSFHHFDFKPLLTVDFEIFRSTIFSENNITKLKRMQRHSAIKITQPLTQ